MFPLALSSISIRDIRILQTRYLIPNHDHCSERYPLTSRIPATAPLYTQRGKVVDGLYLAFQA